METVSLTEAIQFCILLVGIYASIILTAIVYKVKDHDDNFTRAMGNVQSALGQASDDDLRLVDEYSKDNTGVLKLRDVKRSTD